MTTPGEATELTYEEALALKESLRESLAQPAEPDAPTDLPKRWRAVIGAESVDIAAQFLNVEPAQGPGEASLTNRTRADGRVVVDIFFYA